MYTVKQFLDDCYDAAEKQGAYRLKNDEQARACIQAARYVLRDALQTHGKECILRLISSDNWTVENIEKDQNKFDTPENDYLE